MQTFLLMLAGVALVLHLYRQYWTYRSLPQVYTAEFAGELYRVGETVIARRPAAGGSRRTIIGFPGFLEDMRYFQALYEDADCELILFNNADYHSPFPAGNAQRLEWTANPYPVGSIEHDGFWLALAVRDLAGGDEIILHGHSRGGAVVLEAGRQLPELMRGGGRRVSAILEAPVLPRGRMIGRASEPWMHRIICYLLPVVLGLSRRASVERLLKQPMMRPTNALKTHLCQSVYSVARHYRTCVDNLRSIYRWQRERSYELYDNYARITVVVGARDDVLDNATMLASAEAGQRRNPGVTILRTAATNHFVTLEQPHYLRQLVVAGG